MVRFPSFSLGGRERSILQGIEDHLSAVMECVVAYQGLVSACAAQDPSADKLLAGVFDLETKADTIQRDLDRRIAEGAFFGGIREDILGLIHTDDTIADAAKDAARLLVIGADGDPAFLGLLRSEHMAHFQRQLLAAVTSLQSLIRALRDDRKSAVSKIHAVDDCEELADIEKNELLRELFSRPRTMDPVTVIQLRDFIFASDNIADNAESAGDVIMVLVAKGYG